MPQRVEGSVEIDAPVDKVYGYWETLENLPYFMRNIEEVTRYRRGHYSLEDKRTLRHTGRIRRPYHA